ncbi:hypothetical protein BU23DRAFT_600643 [Bimuria novae-zelandiae CBS 107.79]|uniref:SET domain-containing protein n=1 Tax=Bimuria novae-zelandiae CBS 107.79 TaxID=1447943 RepID=A0A6A5V3T2_9PLEO|nr:hypothetical protein BU23DRAFT_600643 [Bimuria novae-zelandiae CBS 107.79]
MSAVKGLGVFAKADIPLGTRVFEESALLACDSDDANAILDAFENLDPSQKDTYLNLHSHSYAPEHHLGANWHETAALHRRVLAIYNAYAFFEGVYPLGTRLNYSCIPNIVHVYNPAIKKRTYHAIRDIAADE